MITLDLPLAASHEPPFTVNIAVHITNRQRSLSLDRPRIRRAVHAVLGDAEIGHAEISIAIVDDATIARLHQQYLDDPEPTDVLSFVLERSDQYLEGEVVVSAETAVAYAARHKSTPQDELLRYVIHGTLHLTGYDDATPRQRTAMQTRERKYLRE